MQINSLVECIKGEAGIIEKGSIYTVSDITHKGNILLYEVQPPFPHTSFLVNRFREIQEPTDVSSIVDFINIENYA